jgi:2-oxoisovalerate dehydrogenase E1 component
MHLFDAATRFYGGNAIVAGGLPIAVGLALAERMLRRDTVTACFFGEGAVDEGEFHESMNLAALWDLPVLFCCENNLYSMGTPSSWPSRRPTSRSRPPGYGMPAGRSTAWTCSPSSGPSGRVTAIRGGEGPHFLEFRTYRFRAHSMYDPELYRSKEEVEAWRERDPITTFEALLREAGILDDAASPRSSRRSWPSSTTRSPSPRLAARAARGPRAVRLLRGRWHREHDDRRAHRHGSAHADLPRGGARGIREALQADERVFLMGEDVGAYGGCFAVTMGLLDEFGPERIRDTPLSESTFVGAGIGAAMAGHAPDRRDHDVQLQPARARPDREQRRDAAAHVGRPVQRAPRDPHHRRCGAPARRPALAQLRADLRPRPGHQGRVGRDRRGRPAWLLAARSPIPTRSCCSSTRRCTTSRPSCPRTRRSGGPRSTRRSAGPAATSPSSPTAPRCTGCSPRPTTSRGDGIDAEVIDLRMLRPLDEATVLDSVARTHRLVVVEEAWRTGGIGAEVAARVAEQAFWDLDAPIGRVGGVEVPTPYARHLEEAAIPQPDAIAAAVERTVVRRWVSSACRPSGPR